MKGLRALLCAPTCRMVDQPHEDESQDNVGTGAEISTENDVPANVHGPFVHDGPDGAPQIAPADVAPTVAGAETGAVSINRVQCRSMMRGWEDYTQINPMSPFYID